MRQHFVLHLTTHQNVVHSYTNMILRNSLVPESASLENTRSKRFIGNYIAHTCNAWAACLCLVFLVACSKEGEQQTGMPDTTQQVDTSAAARVTKTGTQDFLQSLPNTLHMARLFKRTGMPYDASLLHDPSRVSDYVDPTAQALNLGVYSADMGYAIIHGKNQAALQDLRAVKNLADALQLNLLYDTGPWLEKFEKHMDEPDSVLSIVSQLQMQSDLLLRDNSRFDVLYFSFAGAYIESLHLATSLESRNSNPELVQRIAEQQLALGKLIMLIESLENPDRYQLLLGDLKSIYDMMLKLDAGLAAKEPEKARELAKRELYPRVKTARSRIIAKS